MVLAWDDDESIAEERELLHVLPNNLGLDYRYVVRYSTNPRTALLYKNMKELPEPKKMTVEDIEKELGYKIEIINNK